MKKELLIAGFTALVLAVSLPDANAQNSVYREREWSLDLFGSGSIGQQTIDSLSGSRIEHDIRLGGGGGVNYFFTRYLGVSAEAYSENPRHSFIDDASLNVVVRVPLGSSRFAPYALGGGGRQFDSVERWHAQLGGGIEYRFTPRLGLFLDGRYVMADGGKNFGFGRGGLRFSF